MIKQSELLFFNTPKSKLDKTYFLLASMLTEMENDDPRRGLTHKLLTEYATESHG